jgi:glycerophosphoryl diester phosphodiesterase
LNVGADVLELDVHLSRDGLLVVCHDPDLRRVSGDEGRIRELTLAELRQVDAGALWQTEDGSRPYAGKGLTLLTLEELFTALPDAPMNVDIKVPQREAAEQAGELIRRYRRQDRTVVASFIPKQLRRIRQKAPDITSSAGPRDVRLFYLLSRLGLERLASERIPYLQVPERHGRLRLVTPRFIRAAHAAGREVHVWTVNSEEDMRRLISLGVDGIITDYPSRLSALLNTTEKGTPS